MGKVRVAAVQPRSFQGDEAYRNALLAGESEAEAGEELNPGGRAV